MNALIARIKAVATLTTVLRVASIPSNTAHSLQKLAGRGDEASFGLPPRSFSAAALQVLFSGDQHEWFSGLALACPDLSERELHPSGAPSCAPSQTQK